jgi:hypothetical protein
MKKEFIAVIVDRYGDSWVYEGHTDGHPLFVKESESFPKMLTEDEAFDIASEFAGKDEIPQAKRKV